jgi:Lrp/AsnC family transcriptional regulator, regulator for asnA, asnC and gidA
LKTNNLTIYRIMRRVTLDKLDAEILQMVVRDARIPFLKIARLCKVSGASVHQRIHKLTESGVIRSANYVVNPDKLGYETCAFIGIYLKDPESFDEVVKALAKIPEVVECHYTTGKYDMFAKIYARNNHHLMCIIRSKLQGIGIARTETLISFNERIHRQVPILSTMEEEEADDRLHLDNASEIE